MKKPGKKMGRPRVFAEGSELKRLSVYGDENDLRLLRGLAAKWRCSQAAAVRRAIAVAAEQEGLE